MIRLVNSRDGADGMAKWWKIAAVVLVVFLVLIAFTLAFGEKPREVIGQQDRLDAIPADAVKATPSTDFYKPVVHSSLWSQPVPMPGLVNTAGAEDSPFFTIDGSWFFFFFTPDVAVPPQSQLLDGVTGLWWTRLVDGNWTSPEKIILNDDLSLDGAEFVLGNEMWFASARTGNYGEIDVYTAEYEDGEWKNVENAGALLNQQYDIGEFHITSNGSRMYYHDANSTGGSDLDLWYIDRTPTGWGTPHLVPGVNTGGLEGYPYLSPDGSELWYTGTSQLGLGYWGPAIFRCLLQPNGTWGPAEEIVSSYAGECTIDADGNIYFTHHYYSADHNTMIEADIYVAYRL